MSIYNFSAKTIDGKEKKLSEYEGKVLLIVNTASKCGFTKQYGDLEKLYEKYNSKGFEILGFPCNQFAEQEPADNNEIQEFCQLNFGVTFPLFEKINVRGEEAHPLFKYLSEAAPFEGLNEKTVSGKFLFDYLSKNFPKYLDGNSIKWNFTKFLINRNGEVVKRYESPIEPLDISATIDTLL